MFSLPLIIPREDFLHTFTQPPTNSNLPHQNPNTSLHPTDDLDTSYRTTTYHTRNSPLSLSSLLAEERDIEARKLNIRRFGSTWLRPPGVMKTLQAAMDEAAEREEQELIARREMAMMELAEAQEQEERRRQMEERGEVEEEGEVDLDADVPEAGDETLGTLGSEMDGMSEEELMGEDEDGEVDLDADVPSASGSENGTDEDESAVENTFEEEDSAIIASLLSATEAELSGAAQEARDLDDEIPEAGDYEHTDTDYDSERSESPSDENSGRLGASSRPGTGNRSTRAPPVFESPHWISSPAVPPAPATARTGNRARHDAAAPPARGMRLQGRGGNSGGPSPSPFGGSGTQPNNLFGASMRGMGARGGLFASANMVTPEQQHGRNSTSFLSDEGSSFLESSPAMPARRGIRRGRGR